jgi:hypothetical protein
MSALHEVGCGVWTSEERRKDAKWVPRGVRWVGPFSVRYRRDYSFDKDDLDLLMEQVAILGTADSAVRGMQGR